MSDTSANTAPAVYRAISRVMDEIGKTGMRKAGENKSQGFAFRGIDQIYDALNPIMVKHGLMILPRYGMPIREQYTTAKGGNMFSVLIPGEFDIVCAEDGSRHTISTIGEAMDSGDKGASKAMSAAFKYAALQAFCIPVTGNDDADAHSPEAVRMRRSDRENAQLAVWKINAEEAINRCDSNEALDSYKRSSTFKSGWAKLDDGEKATIGHLFTERRAQLEPPLGDDRKEG